MKIRPVGVELFHADGRTHRHDKANSRYSQFWKLAYKRTSQNSKLVHNVKPRPH